MSHEPKLNLYTIELKPTKSSIEATNRWFFRNLINQTTDFDLDDTYIFTDVFRKFIHALDQPEMFSDTSSKKCMTANQLNLEDDSVNENIHLHSHQFIIEGKVEGGSFGRKRNKTSTADKRNKTEVNKGDAITEDFYFLLYSPFQSSKSVLMLQSFSDDSIDSVMKKFFQKFMTLPVHFNKPTIKRFIPSSIIEDFRNGATVSSLSFSTDIPGETLLEGVRTQRTRNYKVTVKIDPIDEDLTLEEFDRSIEPIQQNLFTRFLRLNQFSSKKGTLRDNITNKTSPFDLGTSFDVQPSILLSKYIEILDDETDFDRIKNYCFSLLHTIKPEIYIQHAIRER